MVCQGGTVYCRGGDGHSRSVLRRSMLDPKALRQGILIEQTIRIAQHQHDRHPACRWISIPCRTQYAWWPPGYLDGVPEAAAGIG